MTIIFDIFGRLYSRLNNSSRQQLLEIRNRRLQSLFQLHQWLPFQLLPRQGNIRLTLFGIISWQWLMNELRAGARQLLHLLRQLDHAELTGVAEVHRAGDGVVAVHQAHEAFDQVIDVAEGARLGAVAVEGDGLVA